MQTLFQVPLGHERSVWGGNPGWQREIAFWNVGAAIIVWYTLRLADTQLALALVRGFTVLFLLLGSNHLLALLADPLAQFHWPPMLLNYLGFLYGLRALWSMRGALT